MQYQPIVERCINDAWNGVSVSKYYADGSANLRELMRRIAEDAVNAIMDAEADQLCAGGANSRNGYRERNLVTCVG